MSESEKIMDEVLSNIRSDRDKIDELLKQITECFSVKYNKKMSEDEYAKLLKLHIDAGSVAAKYLESKQKSNEQLVKILTMVYKNSSEEHEEEADIAGMSDNIFEMIKEENSKKSEG